MSDETVLDDRRDALRQKCRVDTVLVECNREFYTCKVLDISRTGMRIQMPVCVPCGSNITILPPKGYDLKVSQARIVRQRVVDEGETTRFECGVHYTERVELRRHSWFLTLRQAA